METVFSEELKARDLNGDGVLDTMCNWGVNKICETMGYHGFKNPGNRIKPVMLANEMHDFMLKENIKWIRDSPVKAVGHAKKNCIAIASSKGKKHGHVAVVYPGPLVYSNKWNKEVPLVANIGKLNGILGANWAFNNEPDFFLLVESTI